MALVLVACGSGGGTKPAPSGPTPNREAALAIVGTPALPVVPVVVASPTVAANRSAVKAPAAPASGVVSATSCDDPGPAVGGLGSSVKQLVVVAQLNLRHGPGTDCPVVGAMTFGTVVSVFGPPIERGGYRWQRMKTPQGEGYSILNSLQPLPAPDERPLAVPILMYHHIATPASRYYVTPQELDWQMGWLRDNGYVSITPTDLYNALYNDLPLPAKPVMITVDDGFRTDLEFQQVLASYGFRGTYFWPNVSYLTADEMAQIAPSGEVCGHTVNHADLSKLSDAKQRHEIEDNKTWLEGIVGAPVTCFGYPFGAYNDDTDGIVADVGYRLAFNAWGPPAKLNPNNRWHIKRFEVNGGFTVEKFADIVENGQ